MADLDITRLPGFQQAARLQIRHHALAGIEAVQPRVRPGVGVQGTVLVEDVDAVDTVPVPRPHVVIVGVVRRGDLHAAAAELGLGPLVADQRHGAVE